MHNTLGGVQAQWERHKKKIARDDGSRPRKGDKKGGQQSATRPVIR